MTNKNAILKRVMRTQTADVMHSSGYAGAQNAGNFGAASTESFAQRRSVEEQRKFVRGYRNSRIIGGATNGVRAKTYTPPPPKSQVAAPANPRTMPRKTI